MSSRIAPTSSASSACRRGPAAGRWVPSLPCHYSRQAPRYRHLMLDGVTPVPAEFAARYRERGYWDGPAAVRGVHRRAGQVRRPGRGGGRGGPGDLPGTVRALGPPGPRPARSGLRAAGPDHRAAAEHGDVRLPLLRAAADRGRARAGPAGAPQAGDHPVRRDLRGAGAGRARGRPRLRLHRDGGRGDGVEPGSAAVFRAGRGRPPARDTAGPAVRAPGGTAGTRAAGVRAGAGRGQHRPGRPGAVPALRRDHRDPQAHPQDPQRLPVQLQDRRGRVRDRRGRRAARRAADRAQPAARLPGHAGLSAVRRDRRAGHEHPAPGRVRADPAAPGDAHPPGARAADPVDRRPGHHRVRPVLAAGDPERRAAAAARGPAARGTRPAGVLHPGELRHGRGLDHVRSALGSSRSTAGNVRPARLPRRRGLPGGRRTGTWYPTASPAS